MAREPQGGRRIGAPTLDMAGTFLIRQEQKFGCRELSKTTSSCRDPATESNASAGGSRTSQLSVSYFMVEGDSFLLSVRTVGIRNGPGPLVDA